MITVIQVVLIVAIVALMARLLSRRSARSRAVWLLLGVAFTLFAVVAVLFPNITGVIANWVGVGRGTDLLLYALVIVVLVVIVQQNLQHQDDQRRFAKTVRAIALMRAGIDYPDVASGGTSTDNDRQAPSGGAV